MKILLLSDIPPCDNYTGGLVLSAMVRFVPRDAICCFAVVNEALDIRPTPEFANIPIEYRIKPNENWSWLPRRRFIRKVSSIIGLIGESLTARTKVESLISDAVRFGNVQKVDRVWAVLQGQTTIRMAKQVADRLGVPLHTHVWDPFSWWAKANQIDGITTRRVQSLFDEAIANSTYVATASEPMAELYRTKFGIAAVPVISSHSESMAKKPRLTQGDEPLLIGMAGQFYAAGEWLRFVKAMNSSGWKVGGRTVRVIVMGPQRPPGASSSHVSYLGWKTQEDAALILSQCDALYCPYPFDPGMEEVSRYSFPSKLVLYLAAGRPILFHGPAYSAPAHYIKDKKCGLVAPQLTSSSIYNELERIFADRESYKQMAINAQVAFRENFTLETMARCFNDFIGADAPSEQKELQLFDHSLPQTAISHSVESQVLPGRYLSVHRIYRSVRGIVEHNSTLSEGVKAALRMLGSQLSNKTDHSGDEKLSYSSSKTFAHAETMGLGTVATAEQSALASRLRASPRTLADHYVKSRILVLLTESNNQKSPAAIGDNEEYQDSTSARVFHVGDVNYVILPETKLGKDTLYVQWNEVLSALPQSTLSWLVRLTLQGGIDRVVVAGENVEDVVMAAAVSNLASASVTVLVDHAQELHLPKWINGKGQVEFVDAAFKHVVDRAP